MGFEAMVWRMYDMATWIMRMILLNSLWIIFTLIGLGIFGFFPATAAMFAVTRRWVTGDVDIPVFKTFWQTYRKDFVQTNIIGYVIFLFGLILYIDVRFLQVSANAFLSLLNFLIIVASFLYFAAVLYIFPLYVHFDCNTFEYIKRAFIIVVGKPLHSIMMITGSYLVYILMSMVPILLLFFSGSLFSLVLMRIAMMSFPKTEMNVGVTK